MDPHIQPRHEHHFPIPDDWDGERVPRSTPPPTIATSVTKTTKSKRDWSLMPLSVLGEIIDVMQWANERPETPYTPGSWRDTPNWREAYTSALLRHIDDFQQGRERDRQSGLRSLAHAGSCIVIMIARSRMEEAAGVRP